jgi:hypothetical protein
VGAVVLMPTRPFAKAKFRPFGVVNTMFSAFPALMLCVPNNT